MAITFNLSTFSKNLMNMGSNFLQMGTMYGMSQSNRCGGGGWGGNSIWGGGGGFGGYGMGAPSPFLSHPMYGEQGADPYLAQMGMADAANYGAARAHYDMQKMQAEQDAKLPLVPEGQSTEQAENFDAASKANKDYKFVTDGWQELNNKADKTKEDEQKLGKEYKQFVVEFAKSYVERADQKGDKDGTMSKEEYMKQIKESYPDRDAKGLEKMFDCIDTDKNGVVDYTEAAAMFYLIDKDKNDDTDGIMEISNNKAIGAKSQENPDELKKDLVNSYKLLFGN